MLGNILDIFANDAFSAVSLTRGINDLSAFPMDLGRVGKMGLFEESGINTDTVVIEMHNNSLSMIPNTPVGAPPNQVNRDKRTVRSFLVPNLPVESQVLAAEIQNVRAFGGTQLQAVQDVINRRAKSMVSRLDATVEYHRVGAIKGIILDADGSTTLYNLFTEFGETQDSVDFLLGTSTTEILKKCLAVSRLIEDELGAGSGFTGVKALCGETFWERLTTHAIVKDAFAFYQANRKSEDVRKTGFEFGGITFYEYRATVGGVDFIADSEAHFFPVGSPGLFQTTFSPASFMETVNSSGLPRYMKQERMKYDRGIDLLLESRPFSFCTKPKSLIKGTTSN